LFDLARPRGVAPALPASRNIGAFCGGDKAVPRDQRVERATKIRGLLSQIRVALCATARVTTSRSESIRVSFTFVKAMPTMTPRGNHAARD
jgi:hypothetical protein